MEPPGKSEHQGQHVFRDRIPCQAPAVRDEDVAGSQGGVHQVLDPRGGRMQPAQPAGEREDLRREVPGEQGVRSRQALPQRRPVGDENEAHIGEALRQLLVASLGKVPDLPVGKQVQQDRQRLDVRSPYRSLAWHSLTSRDAAVAFAGHYHGGRSECYDE